MSVVEISIDRLKQLEALEASLPARIEEALKEHKAAALRRLHEKDKQNPQAVNERAKRYAQKNRDVLNAKRREKRHLEKLANQSQLTQPTATTIKKPITVRKKPAIVVEQITSALNGETERDVTRSHPCPVSEDGRTVRFND
jgi:hypothetical protein